MDNDFSDVSDSQLISLHSDLNARFEILRGETLAASRTARENNYREPFNQNAIDASERFATAGLELGAASDEIARRGLN